MLALLLYYSTILDLTGALTVHRRDYIGGHRPYKGCSIDPHCSHSPGVVLGKILPTDLTATGPESGKYKTSAKHRKGQMKLSLTANYVGIVHTIRHSYPNL